MSQIRAVTFKTGWKMKKAKAILIALLALVLTSSQANAESGKSQIKSGIKYFHANQYKKAISKFGMALGSEFNNPKLHYYLANCYVKTGKNDAAIREFRIAQALSPDSEIGKFSAQALDDLLGKTRKEPVVKDSTPAFKQPTKLERQLSKTFDSLDKQSKASAASKYSQSSARASSYSRAGDSVVERARLEMLRSMLDSGRNPRLSRGHKRQLRELRRVYQARARGQKNSSTRQVQAVQTSSENLKRLLNESRYSSGHRLKPQGTNLYIRNYGSD